MTITQTVDIPVDRRITLEVPSEIPAGRTIIAFTPAHEIENPRYNTKALDAIAEAEAMLQDKLPTNWRKPHELEKTWKELLDD